MSSSRKVPVCSRIHGVLLFLVASFLLSMCVNVYFVLHSQSSPERDNSSDLKVAVMISITHEDDEKYLDLLAALSKSVENLSKDSRYTFEKVAIIKPGFSKCQKTLRLFGFERIEERTSPVDVSEIRPGHYQTKVAKSGCCGIDELLKLHAFTFAEYHRVIHVDSDVLFMKNLDHLLEAPDHIWLQYTNSTLPGESLSGGLLIAKPSLKVFEDVKEIIRGGDYRYDGSGWGGSGVGYCYGGETIQGVLPYYFEVVLGSQFSRRLDRCLYNNQGAELCKDVDPERVFMFHMTVCRKPWVCSPMRHLPICAFVQNQWWELAWRKLDDLNLPRHPRCDRNDPSAPQNYVPIKYKW